MKRSVLIIDDEKDQAIALHKSLKASLLDTEFSHASAEEEILEAVDNRYYSIAIVDLRMDKYEINGIGIIKRIFEVNPFAHIIIVSAFTGEYLLQLKDILTTGKVIDVIEKDVFSLFSDKIKNTVEEYHDKLFDDPSAVNDALLGYYSQAKNEEDTYRKGEQFEQFISLLFQSIGYSNISKRVIDRSRNEVDLIIRNEISDGFLNKFGKYILVECKNIPASKVDKNMFIIFNNKLKNTNMMAELGILATTGGITSTTYLEAIRTSGSTKKVIILSNTELLKLINSIDRLETFKTIMDAQVKDN
ncbi:MAG: response regulator [Phocaeicola sp.]